MWRRLSHFALVYKSIKSNCASQTHPKIWIRRACKRLEVSWMNANTILQNLKQRWCRVWLTTQLFCKNLVRSFRPVQYNILNVLVLLVAPVGENQEVFTLPHVFRTIPIRNATESNGVRANFCGVRVSLHGLAGANLAGTPMYRARTLCGVRAFYSDSARTGVGLVRARTRAESED